MQEKEKAQSAHWINFGVAPDENGTIVTHPCEVWYRESYDVAAPIRKINIVKKYEEEGNRGGEVLD